MTLQPLAHYGTRFSFSLREGFISRFFPRCLTSTCLWTPYGSYNRHFCVAGFRTRKKRPFPECARTHVIDPTYRRAHHTTLQTNFEGDPRDSRGSAKRRAIGLAWADLDHITSTALFSSCAPPLCFGDNRLDTLFQGGVSSCVLCGSTYEVYDNQSTGVGVAVFAPKRPWAIEFLV